LGAFLACHNVPKLIYSHVEIQKFSGGETPGPHSKGRPRLTRQGRGASNAGKGGRGMGREGVGEGKGRGTGGEGREREG